MKARAITHPRDGEQETAKMVRMVLQKEELIGFPGMEVRCEQETGVSGGSEVPGLRQGDLSSAGITPQRAALGEKFWNS